MHRKLLAFEVRGNRSSSKQGLELSWLQILREQLASMFSPLRFEAVPKRMLMAFSRPFQPVGRMLHGGYFMPLRRGVLAFFSFGVGV